MPNHETITVPVRLDQKTFKRFAWFDMFILRRGWVRPAIFSLLIPIGAAALLSPKEDAGLIAAVLMVIGVGLPLVYFGSFLSQVNMQAVRHRLKPPRRVYTVTMGPEGVTVENNQKAEEKLHLKWEEIRQAIRARGCVYLYVTPARAFLLPDGQADAPDEALWALLERNLGQEKCRIRARKL